MTMAVWNKIKRPLEFLLWAGVLGFLFLRLGPQVTAIWGMGEGEEDLAVVAFRTLEGEEFTKKDLEGKVIHIIGPGPVEKWRDGVDSIILYG